MPSLSRCSFFRRNEEGMPLPVALFFLQRNEEGTPLLVALFLFGRNEYPPRCILFFFLNTTRRVSLLVALFLFDATRRVHPSSWCSFSQCNDEGFPPRCVVPFWTQRGGYPLLVAFFSFFSTRRGGFPSSSRYSFFDATRRVHPSSWCSFSQRNEEGVPLLVALFLF